MFFSIFAQGFFLQASLILALGAQNIFLLNAGLRRQRHLVAATVCSVCDAILIFIGVLGVASLFMQIPILKISLGALGVAFLFFYGVMKLRETTTDFKLSVSNGPTSSVKQTVIASLGFSLLNPHVYLDTVVLIGGYSSKFPALTERFYFGAGASVFSVLWFFGLALLASAGGRLLNNSRAMKIISFLSGIILILLSIKLGIDVFGWATNGSAAATSRP